MKIRILIYALGILFLAGPAAAKIYKWKDESGKTHFTDNPTSIPKKYQKKLNAIPDAPARVKTPPRIPLQYEKNIEAPTPDSTPSPDDNRWLKNINRNIKKGTTAIHLPFEKSLDNLGPVAVTGKVYEGEVNYPEGKNGLALHTAGDGSWVEVNPKSKLRVGDWMEVSFKFHREDWANPYKGGSGVQTIATVSGRNEKRINHLTIGFYPRNSMALAVSFRDDDNKNHRMRTEDGVVTLDWHEVRLVVDGKAGETKLYFDGRLAATEPAVSAVLKNGVDRIKFGTWFKKNQAYRGRIDDFMIQTKP